MLNVSYYFSLISGKIFIRIPRESVSKCSGTCKNIVGKVGERASMSTEKMIFEESTCGLLTTVSFNFRKQKV